uniref:Homeobox domain-containing protein n=1 Tax=Trichobilharzia regenti TaxID=157069 RepID=A0AA85ISG9_TRIRE|nr:unnamed protein product [Trichobilharzia regenti]
MVCQWAYEPETDLCSSYTLLEEVYYKEKRPNSDRIKEIAKSLKLNERMVEIWFRRRRNREKSPIIVKFVESEWKFCYYTTMFTYGLFSLYKKSYLWDVRDAMQNYPYYVMPTEIHWYYMIQLGYYTASLIWVFYEVKRSDFKVLLGHHIATVSLLAFSYITNHHRIGALILLLHDVADCWMEAAKLCKYVKKHAASEVLFTIFVFVWIVTRLTYFPYVLQALHIYWFCLIVKVALQVKTQGCLAKDCRSESELSDSSDPPIKAD